jgi:membrane protease YdiL (CAAX protease family)
MHQQNIPTSQAAGILAAFLIEAALFLATGSEEARKRLGALPRVVLAALLTGLTAGTWLLAGGGAPWQLAATVAVAGVFSFWYLLFPESDVPILVLYGALALGKASAMLYPIPWLKAPTAIIGELAWLRTLLFAVLLFRRPPLRNYGFIPTLAEWRQGVKWFLLFVPVALAVGIPIGFIKQRTLPADPAKIALAVAGTFLGHYIFVALREEVLFRGMLLPTLQKSFGATAGLLTSCLLFGAVHLPMGQFPNWRFVIIGTVAGWFYAKSYQATGSVRSAMVTHALTNVVARVFLST